MSASIKMAWDAAKRGADLYATLLLNPASFAGLLLAQAGSPDRALALVPNDECAFFGRVRAILDALTKDGAA